MSEAVTPENNVCPCDAPEETNDDAAKSAAKTDPLNINSKMHANARHVIQEVLKRFPQVKQIWTWGNGPDHNNGRCCDYMITIPGMKRTDQVELGDAVADYYIKNAERLGLNWLIWNRRIYRYQNTDRGHGWGRYTGPKSHTDHVHAEVEDKTYVPPTPRKPLPWYEVDPTKVDKIHGAKGGLWRVDNKTGKNEARVEPGYRFRVAKFVNKWGRKWALTDKGNLYAAEFVRKVTS